MGRQRIRATRFEPFSSSFAQWKLAIEGYGDQTDQYLSGVVDLFLTGKHPHVKKRLFNPNSYFNKRQFQP